VNNQNFVSIPYEKFRSKLEAKCRCYGMEYVEVEEGYTSQRCSRCGVIRKSNRKHRGLYVCKGCGNVLNADMVVHSSHMKNWKITLSNVIRL